MKRFNKTVWPALVVGVLILGSSEPALAAPEPTAPTITQKKSKVWGAAELGIQGSIIANGTTFLGPVLTVQAGHYRPIVGVFQMGLGVALYKDPIPDQVYAADDPNANPTENNAMFYVGLGLRVRVFQFLASLKDKPFDLYIGPLAMVFGNKDLVTFGAAGELGFAVHIRRVRISLSAHGGYQTLMHQYANAEDYKFEASFVVGGQLAVGLQF